MAVRRQHEIIEGREGTFLYGVALRLMANDRRRHSRHCGLGEADSAMLVAPDLLPDEAAEHTRKRALLDALLEELPDELRRVLVLSDVLELPSSEVAELEGIPAGTVASRLRRARARLKRKLLFHRLGIPSGDPRP